MQYCYAAGDGIGCKETSILQLSVQLFTTPSIVKARLPPPTARLMCAAGNDDGSKDVVLMVRLARFQHANQHRRPAQYATHRTHTRMQVTAVKQATMGTWPNCTNACSPSKSKCGCGFNLLARLSRSKQAGRHRRPA